MAVAKGVAVKEISDQEARDRIRTNSVLWPAPLVGIDRIAALRETTILLAVKQALTELGDIELNVRDIAGSDLGLSTRHWNQQATGAINTWVASTISGLSIPDQRWVGLMGVINLQDQDAVSGIRIEAGGSRLAEWDLQKLFGVNTALGAPVDQGRYGIALSPIILRQNTEITVRYYLRGATNTDALPVEVPFLGVAVETVGGGSGLNP